MVIKVDKEGRAVLNDLFDIALRTEGLKVLQGIINVINSIEEIIEEDKNDSSD